MASLDYEDEDKVSFKGKHYVKVPVSKEAFRMVYAYMRYNMIGTSREALEHMINTAYETVPKGKH